MTELEHKVRALLAILPNTPVEHLTTTGEFWLAIARLRSEVKILQAIRDEERLR